MSVTETAATISDADAIRAVTDAIAAAAYRKDAAAMARHYAPGAVIADLAPPLLSRGTLAFTRAGDIWRITHDHNSVPFHMDGSFRAAIDLDP
jgi:ketosteroid isomerase-like protein